MQSEIEAHANRLAGEQILRRGRKLADAAIRQDERGETAWRILLLGIALFPLVFIALSLLFCPLTASYQLAFGQQHFHVVPPLVTDPSPQRNAYRQQVRAKLESTGNPGTWPGKLHGLDGGIGVTLIINAGGTLQRAVIFAGSDSPVLEERACELAYAAAPYPPFPREMQAEKSMRVASYLAFNYGNAPVESLLSNVKREWSYDCYTKR